MSWWKLPNRPPTFTPNAVSRFSSRTMSLPIRSTSITSPTLSPSTVWSSVKSTMSSDPNWPPGSIGSYQTRSPVEVSYTTAIASDEHGKWLPISPIVDVPVNWSDVWTADGIAPVVTWVVTGWSGQAVAVAVTS